MEVWGKFRNSEKKLEIWKPIWNSEKNWKFGEKELEIWKKIGNSEIGYWKLDNIGKGCLPKKTGFKDIVPKGGRGSGPNPKICCMWNWDMRGVGSQTPICPNFKSDLKTKGDL